MGHEEAARNLTVSCALTEVNLSCGMNRQFLAVRKVIRCGLFKQPPDSFKFLLSRLTIESLDPSYS